MTADLGAQTPAIDDRQQIDDADLAVAVDITRTFVRASRRRTGRTVSGVGPDDIETVVVGGPDTDSLDTAGPDGDTLTVIRNAIGRIHIGCTSSDFTRIGNAVPIACLLYTSDAADE